MILVFDASALIALLKEESGAEVVQTLIDDSANESFAHAINLCEVYYDCLREFGSDAANEVVEKLLSTSLVSRDDMDAAFWQQAGTHKAHLRRISLADCFCASLAERLGAVVITADRREFEPVATSLSCGVQFIR